MELLKTEILNRDLRSQTAALAQAFANAEPYRHVVIQDFFASEFCNRLLNDFPAFDEQLARNERGKVGRKAARSAVRDISSAYEQLDDFIQAPEFLRLISDITDIPDLLYDAEYIGGGTHENLSGQGLDPHVDFNYHPRTGWHRRLNLIVYLNPEWEERWGGNFDLHSNPWEPDKDQIKTVLPLFNQGVIFETSERSWHGFSPVQLPKGRKDVSRKSFAIYLYTRERPADETAASHATVYVPRPLPDDVTPGEVLSDTGYKAIHQRFGLALSMLQFLYQREQRFNRQIEVLRHALEEARNSQRLDLQGYVVQPQPPRGYWPDGWATSELMFQFRPSRPVHGLRLEVMAPSRLKSQGVEIAVGEWRDTAELTPGEPQVLRLPIEADPGETVQVTVRSRESWCGKDRGESEDDRQLAFRVLSASVEH